VNKVEYNIVYRMFLQHRLNHEWVNYEAL